MAKAKKSEAGETPKATKTGGAKKGKGKPAAAGPVVPQIDTGAAASTAAKLIAAGMSATAATPAGAATKESAAFKHLKDGFTKPASSAMANLLDKAGPANLPKTHHTPFGQKSQVGRNQTFGADVNRAGVPRRTGGG